MWVKKNARFRIKENNLTYGRRVENYYIEQDGYVELVITSNNFGAHNFIIDKSDALEVKKYTWHLKINKNGRTYARTNLPKNIIPSSISLHQLIFGDYNNTDEIDHIDNNSKNNRRNNLRLSTHSQNNSNKGIQSNNTSSYKGVYVYKNRNKPYWSYIWVNNKRISGGYFEKIEDAAKKYNELAIKFHGEFANLNIIK